MESFLDADLCESRIVEDSDAEYEFEQKPRDSLCKLLYLIEILSLEQKNKLFTKMGTNTKFDNKNIFVEITLKNYNLMKELQVAHNMQT